MPGVPEPILEYLQCDLCSCWLSIGPIIVLSSYRSICGRCVSNNAVQAVPQSKLRHVAYERVACFYQFPCKYWKYHCSALLEWNEAGKHEENCVYGSAVVKYCAKPQLIFKKERKLNLNEDIKLFDIPEELLEQLRCYLCEGYLSCIPIIISREGRNICHRCFSEHGAPDRRSQRHIAFELLLETFIFPCIYRFRGCTIRYKFGEEIWGHELECSYGRIFKKTKTTNSKGKERGVIETHTGHVYGTLTPNKALFAPPDVTGKQGQFLSEFQRHRESLASKWGAVNTDKNENIVERKKNLETQGLKDDNDKGQQISQKNFNRFDNIEFGQTIRHNLIDELKNKQKRRSEDVQSITSLGRFSDTEYPYQNEYLNRPKKISYSVY